MLVRAKCPRLTQSFPCRITPVAWPLVVGSSGGSVLGALLMSSSMKVAAVKVARVSQYGTPEELADARRELALANIEAAIERNLAASPPLTPEQKNRIAALLRTGGQR